MKHAISMFLGGEVINAKDCNYTTNKELGLICPICKEAVFLVKECTKQRNGKIFDVPAHFNHYSAIGITDCENRIKTPEGKQILNQLTAEAKNQRLSLYNQRLLKIIAKIHTQKKAINDLCKKAVKSLDKLIEIESSYFAEYCEYDVHNTIIKKMGNVNLINFYSHLSGYNFPIFHQIVFEEVMQYLATKTGKEVRDKILRYVFNQIILKHYRAGTEFKIDSMIIFGGVAEVVYTIPWATIIDSELNNPHRFRGVGFGQ